METPSPHTNCSNCDTPLQGEYCHICGQEKFDYQSSFRHVLSHFLGDYFTFDSKLFKSILPLLIKPGFLTSEYMSGHRVKYISPVRFYVFISILYFILATYHPLVRDVSSSITVTGEVPEQSNVATESEATMDEDSSFDQLVASKLDLVENNADIFQNAFNRNLPKAMFFLLPLFALLLKLIYIRKKRLLIEHFIFALHYHSFVFLLLTIQVILALVLGGLLANWVFDLFFIPIVLYLFFAMKRYYDQGIGRTLAKFALLLFAYAIFIVISLLTMLIYTFLTL